MAGDARGKLEHAFVDLAKRRRWEDLKSMLAKTPDLVNVQPVGRWSALHQAVSSGSEGIVAHLLAHSADVNARTSCARTAEDLALSNPVLLRLLSRSAAGSTVSALPTPELEHLFLDFAKVGNWKEVKRMLAETPDLVNSRPAGRWSALHQAAARGDADIVAHLLSCHADASARSTCGRTPADMATGEAVGLLCCRGDIGGRPLAGAMVLEVLSSGEEDVPPKPSEGHSPRAKRARYEDHEVRQPIVAGAEVAFGAASSSLASLTPATSNFGAADAPKDGYAAFAHLKVGRTKGPFELHKSSGGLAFGGAYVFDPKTRCLHEQTGAPVGIFLDAQVSAHPFAEHTLAVRKPSVATKLECVTIVDSEIMDEIQKPANADAFFVLPSQLNGAEYPSDGVIVNHIDKYRHDKTGGPRGQLAVHPAAGQFVLDNAACDHRPEGISAVDLFLPESKLAMSSSAAKEYGVHLRNGYLGLPDCAKALQEDVLHGFRSALHTLRCLGMQGVPACGLAPTLDSRSIAVHRVSLIYASAVPVQSYLNRGGIDWAFQEEVGRLFIVGQYYGALRLAAMHAAPARIYLMPLGGGVFNNRVEVIAGAISLAIDLLVAEGLDVHALLDIRLLTFRGKPSESAEMVALMNRLGKLRVPQAAHTPGSLLLGEPALPTGRSRVSGLEAGHRAERCPGTGQRRTEIPPRDLADLLLDSPPERN